MAGIMEEVGLVHEFHITPEDGHWYPDNLTKRIDRALAQIREGRGKGEIGVFPSGRPRPLCAECRGV